jgi:uncharacterized protein GlcG (DUF336 family)
VGTGAQAFIKKEIRTKLIFFMNDSLFRKLVREYRLFIKYTNLKWKTTMKTVITRIFILIIISLSSIAVHASDIIKETTIGMELSRDIATEAINACRNDGYHISAVVVDRFGLVRAALRDDNASRFTLDIAERKANLTVMAWTDSSTFRKARADIQQELNHINGLIVMGGGLRIVAGGYNIGSIGVSGAPGSEKDEACARKALEKLAERIEFAVD